MAPLYSMEYKVSDIEKFFSNNYLIDGETMKLWYICSQ